MITPNELRNLMSDVESDRVERTLSIDKGDKFAEAICAFSNDFPNHRQNGYLLVGVSDDGSPKGVEVTDRLLQTLSGIRSDGNVQPIPAMSVYVVRLEPECVDIVVTEVVPSEMPPARYKGRTWIRVGPRRAIATEAEERILSERRTAYHLSFDATPCPDAVLDDIALDLFVLSYLPNAVARDIIEENHRDLPTQLASLRFYDLKKKTATYASLILFGKNPLNWLPGACIQFLRLDGTDLAADVRSDKRISGDLITVLRELDALIEVEITSRPVRATELTESEQWDYPTVAIREILLNAIAHRSYQSNAPIRFYWFDDRIEIQSPGGLYGEATPENFPAQNSYRNPVLAEALRVLGYVNKFGRGVIRAQDALRKNGNPAARFQFDATYVLVTIWGKRP